MAELTSSLVAPPPKHSLSVSISVYAGIAQSTRSLGLYSGYYPSVVSTTEMYLELVPAATWAGSASDALFINTDQPLSFLGTKADNTTVSFQITRMLFLDQPFKSWSISNMANTTATVFVASSTPSNFAGTPVEAPVLSVNGNYPDASGNVTVNTGVMTINDDVPDASGNINTDEKTY